MGPAWEALERKQAGPQVNSQEGNGVPSLVPLLTLNRLAFKHTISAHRLGAEMGGSEGR